MSSRRRRTTAGVRHALWRRASRARRSSTKLGEVFMPVIDCRQSRVSLAVRIWLRPVEDTRTP